MPTKGKGIWQTKCTMDANQATKHMLLQKANINLQGCSTLQEINPEQVSREDYFHLYSCISQDLFSQVNTHQQGLKSCARAATYCLAAYGAEAGALPGHAVEDSMSKPCLGAQLDPKRKIPKEAVESTFCKSNETREILLITLSGLKQKELVFPSCLVQKEQNCIKALC